MRKKKILLVDDEVDFLDLFSCVLRHAGYTVITAKSGGEALSLVKKNKIDLILLDINMPEMDGTRVGAALKRDPETKKIPVIYLTALLDKQEEKELGHKVGRNFFLAKPCSSTDLLREIKKRI